jgi:hypothetical protein
MSECAAIFPRGALWKATRSCKKCKLKLKKKGQVVGIYAPSGVTGLWLRLRYIIYITGPQDLRAQGDAF